MQSCLIVSDLLFFQGESEVASQVTKVLRAAAEEAGARAPSEIADAEGPPDVAAERMAEQVGQAILQGVGRAAEELYAAGLHPGAAERGRQTGGKAHFGKGD